MIVVPPKDSVIGYSANDHGFMDCWVECCIDHGSGSDCPWDWVLGVPRILILGHGRLGAELEASWSTPCGFGHLLTLSSSSFPRSPLAPSKFILFAPKAQTPDGRKMSTTVIQFRTGMLGSVRIAAVVLRRHHCSGRFEKANPRMNLGTKGE